MIEPGPRRLDGYQTLWYARSRSGSSDYARMGRQRCVIGAILREADPATVLRNFTELATATTSILTTDITQAELPELIDLAWRAKERPITSLQLVPPLISPADPDFDLIADELDRAVEASVDVVSRPDATTSTTAGGTASADEPGAVEHVTDQTAEPAAEDPSQPAVDLSSVCTYE